ncbi:hypothetical protein, unlikely [Trypanosoma brucei brucei TREU927]|uniref:Uncharacterized protein n=1 Tax=Trypanosoma brucei brucei (strain 927/4 GUTat10.1) TaxID=185431 RepID=Q38F19_TRYB2|nr:hypothetical protein, unlikely [Trypanosoma brucei brucei TREU927]EAN76601.1 hypothetical protein, unlikely [Trypanosoma brucei brucei TREU927]
MNSHRGEKIVLDGHSTGNTRVVCLFLLLVLLGTVVICAAAASCNCSRAYTVRREVEKGSVCARCVHVYLC